MKKTVFNEKNFTVENPHAAGIDVGATMHYVAVPSEEDKTEVRKFGAYTSDLKEMASWLKIRKIKTVAMESTGNYWIALYEILVQAGIEVKLVNACYIKNVSGRKTDVLDCQWIQKLHTFGLLSASFIPDEETKKLRYYVRQREQLSKAKAEDLQHISKSLSLMNIKLQHIVSDIEGISAMRIIRDIDAGVTNARQLSMHRNTKMKASEEEIRKSLEGNFKDEYLFILHQSLSSYDFHKNQMDECDKIIEQILKSQIKEGSQEIVDAIKSKKTRKNGYSFNLKGYLKDITKTDLTKVEGLEEKSILTILSETGRDFSKWKSSKHFVSWLRLCPNPQISGGKVIRNKGMRTSNRATMAFRMAAQSLHNSQTPLGSFYRRICIKSGSSTAIKAVARKLATIFYKLMTEGREYIQKSIEYYDIKYRHQIIKSLDKRAKKLGYSLQLIPVSS